MVWQSLLWHSTDRTVGVPSDIQGLKSAVIGKMFELDYHSRKVTIKIGLGLRRVLPQFQ
jgi:hypothetical protein